MKRLAYLLFALSILSIARCSCEDKPGSGPDGPKAVALTITPQTATLTTDGVTPARQIYLVEETYDDGSKKDVSDSAIFSLSNTALGSMFGAEFVSNLIGGTSTITAAHTLLSANAVVHVDLKKIVVIPPPPGGMPLPNDPGEVVGRAPEDPARAPELVYPNDGVLLPLNLGSIEVHFRPGAGNTLFEVSFESALATLSLYTRCAALQDGCVLNVDGTTWDALAMSNRGGAPITVRVRGTDDTGTARGTSRSIAMSISAQPLFGGLYYWTTSNGTGILRVDFGAGQQVPEVFFPFSGGGCYGCHALSRNGKKMSLSQNGISDGRLTLIDVAARNILLTGQDEKREQFQSWNPTSDKFVGVWADTDPPDTNMRIRDGDTGEVVETINIGAEPDHPDWSPLGDRILFTLVTRNEVSQRPGRGGISYIRSMPAGGWSAPAELVPPEDGKNRYYPAYAPSSEFFVYDESTCPQGQIYTGDCDGDADYTAKLWAMVSDGGARIALDRANAPGIEDRGAADLSNSFPKWAPFVDAQRADGSGRLMWLTFSSRRHYGLRPPIDTNQLLWMIAIDPDAILAGRDGSFAAFALPFQDLSTSNHIAQWTARIVPPSNDGGTPDPASDGGPGCISTGEFCDPNVDLCCAGTRCRENGPGIYVCKPEL